MPMGWTNESWSVGLRKMFLDGNGSAVVMEGDGDSPCLTCFLRNCVKLLETDPSIPKIGGYQ